ncbi:hypothetical protein SAMN05428967_2010 [Phyllobacterium sp. YR620]|uniref:PhnA-like protein n=1 Tax=Phyllobacterium pellucidum TaxID=2740464 RepID=A0A849VWA4_9HYPH|nr:MULTISPECIES: hypothetical protein [Phyllobacterium]NTS32517.1 hypothetical protein [Phyllobacterium pellucidum]UGY09904.1 hypothetical protein LLE51_001575 [Phyllobacterium sp. T1018]SDP41492.1 hypothetical protein SAMN05428967_2010 [Phyllobacterium sp. YR620]
MSFTDINSGTDTTVESSSSAVSWGPIVAGSVTAAAASVLLTLLGSGLGLTIVSPWASQSASLTTFAVSTAIWLILIQWLSSGLGGYLTGRLRTKWTGVHTNEVYFRDTAHGFIAWALATLFVAALLGSAVTSTISTGVKAASSVVSGTANATASAAGAAANDTSVSYFVDSLLRPATPATATSPDSASQAAGEVSRILLNAATTGTLPPDDRNYLDQVVASRTGLSEADAKARVDAVLARADEAKKAAAEAADKARKAGATAAFMAAFSLLIGAFIASVAAALGGHHRDTDEETNLAATNKAYK